MAWSLGHLSLAPPLPGTDCPILTVGLWEKGRSQAPLPPKAHLASKALHGQMVFFKTLDFFTAGKRANLHPTILSAPCQPWGKLSATSPACPLQHLPLGDSACHFLLTQQKSLVMAAGPEVPCVQPHSGTSLFPLLDRGCNQKGAGKNNWDMVFPGQ